jgi:hypothetical protein
MKRFRMNTELHNYDTLAAFTSSFNLTGHDLVQFMPCPVRLAVLTLFHTERPIPTFSWRFSAYTQRNNQTEH